MRIFLDANILFSAAKSDGAVRAFLEHLDASGHVLVADGYVVGEARRNLEAKFPAAIADFERLFGILDTSPGATAAEAFTLPPELPGKDRPVLAAAIRHRCDVLLTGDKTHFGHLFLRTVQGVAVHSPATFATHLAKPHRRSAPPPA